MKVVGDIAITAARRKLGIGRAIEALCSGSSVSRDSWDDPPQWLELHIPEKGAMLTRPYIYVLTVQGDRIPWTCSQADLLANDWCVVATREEGGGSATTR